MTETTQELEGLYKTYLSTMERLEKERANFGGALQSLFSVHRPGSDSCNDQFYDNFRLLMERFKERSPASEDVRAVMTYVFDRGRAKNRSNTVNLMLIAVQGNLAPLVELLSPDDAAPLLAEYTGAFPPRRMLPVQKQLLAALEARSRG